jgi:hypothetical protein
LKRQLLYIIHLKDKVADSETDKTTWLGLYLGATAVRGEYHELGNIWSRKLIWGVKAQSKGGLVLIDIGMVSKPGSKRAKLNQVKEKKPDLFSSFVTDTEKRRLAWGWYF